MESNKKIKTNSAVPSRQCNPDNRNFPAERPLTAKNVVDVLVTDRAVFHFTEKGMVLKKVMDGFTREEIAASTEAAYIDELR